jgi:hypothetical protein
MRNPATHTIGRPCTGWLALIAVSLGTSSTTLATQHGSHGSVCTARPGDKDKVDFSTDRGAYNTSTTSSARIYCSIDSDTESSGQDFVRRLDVAYINNSSAGDISCTLYLQDILGATVFSVPLKSSGISTAVRRLTWKGLEPTTNIQYYWAHLSCLLPPKESSGPEPQIRGFVWLYDRP